MRYRKVWIDKNGVTQLGALVKWSLAETGAALFRALGFVAWVQDEEDNLV